MEAPLQLLHEAVAEFGPMLEKHGAIALFVPIFVEGFGIPAPGQTLLIAAALLAHGGRLPLSTVLMIAALATFSGNLVGFMAGRLLGRGFLDRQAASGGLLARVEGLVARHGLGFLIASRFIEGLKQTASLAMGAFGLAPRRFLLGNLLASVCWAAAFSLAPWWLGAHAHQALAFLHQHRLLAWAVALLGLLGVLWRRRNHLAN